MICVIMNPPVDMGLNKCQHTLSFYQRNVNYQFFYTAHTNYLNYITTYNASQYQIISCRDKNNNAWRGSIRTFFSPGGVLREMVYCGLSKRHGRPEAVRYNDTRVPCRAIMLFIIVFMVMGVTNFGFV